MMLNFFKRSTSRVDESLRRGERHIDDYDYDDAIQDFREAVRLDPNNVRAHLELGVAYAEAGETQRAIESYTKAAQLEPGNKEAYMNRALAYHQSEDYQRAIDDDSQVIE